VAYKRISPQPVSEGGTGAKTITGVLTGNGTSAITANAVTQYTVLLGDASNAVSNVTDTGTSGQVLTSAGAGSDPDWGDPALILVDSITQTGGSYISTLEMIDGLSSSANYLVLVYIAPETSGTNLLVEFSTDSGSSWETTGYASSLIYNAYASSSLSVSSSTSNMQIGTSIQQGTPSRYYGEFHIRRQGASNTMMTGTCVWYVDISTNRNVGRFGGLINTINIDSIRFRMSSDGLQGRIRLYRYSGS